MICIGSQKISGVFTQIGCTKSGFYRVSLIVMSDFIVFSHINRTLLLCSFSRKDPAGRRRRNSFFVNGVSKAKMITLQINGLSDKVSTAAYN